jgi:hypothetical protein
MINMLSCDQYYNVPGSCGGSAANTINQAMSRGNCATMLAPTLSPTVWLENLARQQGIGTFVESYKPCNVDNLLGFQPPINVNALGDYEQPPWNFLISSAACDPRLQRYQNLLAGPYLTVAPQTVNNPNLNLLRPDILH